MSTQAIEVTGLSERIAETIDEYTEANPGVTVMEALMALAYVYAVIQRNNSNVPAHKLH